MSVEIIRVTDRGEHNRIPLTGSSGGFPNVRMSKYTSATLIGGDVNSYEEVWENLETVPVLIWKIVINETVGAGIAGGEYVIMGSDANGLGMTGVTCLDGFDANAVAWYDTDIGPVTLGATTSNAVTWLDENGGALSFLTVQYKVQDCASFAATVYIFYFPIR